MGKGERGKRKVKISGWALDRKGYFYSVVHICMRSNREFFRLDSEMVDVGVEATVLYKPTVSGTLSWIICRDFCWMSCIACVHWKDINIIGIVYA